MPCARPSRGWPRPVRRSRLPSSPATSRCTTSTRARRSTRRPSSARSVCWNEPTLAVPSFPRDRRSSILLLGAAVPAHDGSERQALEDGVASGRIPDPALPELTGLFAALGEAARSELLASAHDASDGGLVVAAVELCLGASSGCELELPPLADRGDITLFGEACGNVLVTCARGWAGAPGRDLPASRRCRSSSSAGSAAIASSSVPARAPSTSRSTMRARPTRTPSRWPWSRADVRRVRHPRPGPRRRPPRLLRDVRPAAPGAGERRDRGLGRTEGDRAPRDGARVAGVRRVQAARPRGRGRDRPHALLDDRLGDLAELAADRPAPSRPDRRARPQRQPHEHVASCATSCSSVACISTRRPTPRSSAR